MAQKRMFNNSITDTDNFLDMPATTQNLYFHLNMHADDDGFVDAPRRIMRNLGAHQNDMDLLLAKQFVFAFQSGVLVIRDWKIHNVIRKDTYKPTLYQEEKQQLEEAESGAYQLRAEPVTNSLQLRAEPVTNSYESVAQNRLDKNRLDKSRLDKSRLDKDREDTPSLIIANHCQSHGLFIDGQQLQMLGDFHAIDGMHIDVICRAVTEAADNGKRNLKYILAILRNWKQDGIMTLAQVEDRERQRIEQKARVGRVHQPTETNVPVWSDESLIKREASEEEKQKLAELQAQMMEQEETT